MLRAAPWGAGSMWAPSQALEATLLPFKGKPAKQQSPVTPRLWLGNAQSAWMNQFDMFTRK